MCYIGLLVRFTILISTVHGIHGSLARGLCLFVTLQTSRRTRLTSPLLSSPMRNKMFCEYPVIFYLEFAEFGYYLQAP